MPETTQEAAQAEEVKTFTQEQVDRIVQERVARVKHEPPADYDELKEKAAKYDEAQEAAKSELQKATEARERAEAELAGYKHREEIAAWAKQVSDEYGVPAEVLRGSTLEELKAHAEALKPVLSQKPAYPRVPDAGEPKPVSMTKQEILRIKDKREREKAILDHLDLF